MVYSGLEAREAFALEVTFKWQCLTSGNVAERLGKAMQKDGIKGVQIFCNSEREEKRLLCPVPGLHKTFKFSSCALVKNLKLSYRLW